MRDATITSVLCCKASPRRPPEGSNVMACSGMMREFLFWHGAAREDERQQNLHMKAAIDGGGAAVNRRAMKVERTGQHNPSMVVRSSACSLFEGSIRCLNSNNSELFESKTLPYF